MGRGGCAPSVALLAAAGLLAAAVNQPGSEDVGWAATVPQNCSSGSLNSEIGQRRRAQSTWPISTFAGGGSGGDGGPAASANINTVKAVAVAKQSQGGAVYIASYNNHKIEVVNNNGIITAFAGNGVPGFSGDGGPASSAELYGPAGVALDPTASSLVVYIADQGNNRVRKVANNVIVTVAGRSGGGYGGDGGPATSAYLNNPHGVAVDSNGVVYIADYSNNRVRSVSYGAIYTFAGTGAAGNTGDNGQAYNARINGPAGVAVDGQNNVFIADQVNSCVRVVMATTGVISTLAGISGSPGFSGDYGPASSALLNQPSNFAFDSNGNLFVAEWGNNRIRMVAAGTNIISTIAGTGVAGFAGDGGLASGAEFNGPAGLAVDAANNIYVADFFNYRVRLIASLTSPLPAPSPVSPSPSPSPAPPQVNITWLAVDGPPIRGYVDAGAAIFFMYSQTLPYGVQLTLLSLTGDADLFVGTGPPTLNGSGFVSTASSTNGDQAVDAVGCMSRGPAWSASSDPCGSCFGPLPSTTWYVRVSGWAGGSFSLNASSMLIDPLFIGSPQPSPGAIPSDVQLALGVTAAGALAASDTSVYWVLGVPVEAAAYPTHVYLHIVSGGTSDADLLVGLSPPFGPGNGEFNSIWASTNTGDDWVTIPPIGTASTRIYVAVKAYAAPVTYTLLATSVHASPSSSPGGGGSASLGVILGPVVVGAAVLCILAFIVARQRSRRKARAARIARYESDVAAAIAQHRAPPPYRATVTRSHGIDDSSSSSSSDAAAPRSTPRDASPTTGIGSSAQLTPVPPSGSPPGINARRAAVTAAAAPSVINIVTGAGVASGEWRRGADNDDDALEAARAASLLPALSAAWGGPNASSPRSTSPPAAPPPASSSHGRRSPAQLEQEQRQRRFGNGPGGPQHRTRGRGGAAVTHRTVGAPSSAATFALGVDEDDDAPHASPPPATTGSAPTAPATVAGAPIRGTGSHVSARSLGGGDDDDAASNCTICLCEVVSPVTISCGHSFCRTCLGDWMSSQRTAGNIPKCPMRCPGRLPASVNDLHTNLELERVVAANKRLRDALAAANSRAYTNAQARG